MTRTTATLVALALLQLLPSPACAYMRGIPTHQFDVFFPGWDGMIQEILRTNCSRQYYYYRRGEHGPEGEAFMVFHVIECVLQQFPEFRKSEMAASAVILGLLPTTLQSLGSTSAETSLLGLRRPVLALLVSVFPTGEKERGGGIVEEDGFHKNETQKTNPPAPPPFSFLVMAGKNTDVLPFVS